MLRRRVRMLSPDRTREQMNVSATKVGARTIG